MSLLEVLEGLFLKEKIFSKILDKSNQYKFYKENYTKFKNKNEYLVKKNNSLKDRNDRLKDKNLKLKNRNDRLKDKNQRLKDRNDRLKDKNQIFKDKNQRLKDRNDRLKDKNQIFKDKIQTFKIKNKSLVKKLAFINMNEFLCNSYISPIVKAPFSNEDKKCFAFMDYLSEYLTNIALNSDKPLISVILPIFNRKDRCLVAINSVLNQSYENFELIIVDDCSDDGTSDVLNSLNDGRIKIITHDENKGVSAARNSALKVAKGEYVAYLDSDNDWDLNYLSSMIGAFLKLPDADALYSGQILYHEFDSEPFAVRFGAFNKSLLHNRNYIDLNCFCHKLNVYDKLGGFDEDLLKFVDWDFILRISNNLKIYSVPVLLSYYYHHTHDKRVSFVYNDTDVTYFDSASKIIDKNIYNYPIENSMKRKVNVIIPNHESLNELQKCVDSIRLYNSTMVDIIIIDNNSSDEVVDYLKKLNEKNIAKIILNDDYSSFTHCINQGIKFADENSDILILNNDAILTKCSIMNMQKFAYDNDECGIVVPHEMIYGGNSEMKNHVPYANPDFECDITPSKIRHNIDQIPMFNDDSLLELNFAPFFCIYLKREVYNHSCGFDFELGGYGSDRIFSDYVYHILKRKIYQCPDSFVYHNLDVDSKNLEEYDVESKFNKILFNSNKYDYSKRLWDI